MLGPRTAAAEALHAMKHRETGEGFEEAMNRIASGLQDSNDHYFRFRSILLGMRFLPAGRVQLAIGSSRQVTAYNCFVSGTIEDSFVTGPGCIMDRAWQAAATMRMGGGIGYDFSTLRPRGDLIRKLRSQSTGPVSFMRIFNEICLATASAGHRRGAQMAVLRCDHPDIEEYIKAKQNTDQLNGFNLSIAVTDELMEAVAKGGDFELRFRGEVYSTVDAQQLWEAIMRSTWDWGEPGVLFIDRMNEMNNLYYCETIAATNPCSEQPLPPFGSCLLGSFNLPKYLEAAPTPRQSTQPAWDFNWSQLEDDIGDVVRAMDNVVDRTRYPLPEQKAEAMSKRRMGLGVTGLANAAEAMGYPYGSPEFLQFEAGVLRSIMEFSYRASIGLAREKGAFTLFDEERYPKGKFIQQLPGDIQDGIKRWGIRNSHLTSIAPTGTISQTADNVSSGLEPVWNHSFERPINTPDGVMTAKLVDYGVEFLATRGKLAKDVTAQEHIAVLTTAQKFTDSAVAKTINMDGTTMKWDDFKNLYRMAWEGGAKGCATFNAKGKRAGLLMATDQPAAAMGEGDTCTVDLETGLRSCG